MLSVFLQRAGGKTLIRCHFLWHAMGRLLAAVPEDFTRRLCPQITFLLGFYPRDN